MVSGWVFLFVCVCNVIITGAVVYMARQIARLIRENSQLRESINSLFIEAVWPPHDS
jgi:hypothetical protein